MSSPAQKVANAQTISVGITLGFLAGLILGTLMWLDSPRRFNEKNENNMAITHCVQILEKNKHE